MAPYSGAKFYMAMKMNPRVVTIVIAVVAAIALAGDVFFILRDQGQVTPSQYPYLDPAQATYNNSDLLVNMYPLAQELKALVNGNNNIEIYFQFLNTGSDIRINTTPFFPGSLMKIPIAMAVMKKIESGEWTMNTKLALTDADKNADYGTLYEQPSGESFTVNYLLNQMLVPSDDTARAIFVRSLGDQDIENVLDYLGLQDVLNDDLEVTAQRYSNFWRALYSAGYLSADSSQELLQMMATPHDEDLLYAGIPSSVTFSHKIGVFGYTYSDSGIVYVPNRPYILTVMVQSSSTEEVDEMMKDISRDVYDYVSQNAN